MLKNAKRQNKTSKQKNSVLLNTAKHTRNISTSSFKKLSLKPKDDRSFVQKQKRSESKSTLHNKYQKDGKRANKYLFEHTKTELTLKSTKKAECRLKKEIHRVNTEIERKRQQLGTHKGKNSQGEWIEFIKKIEAPLELSELINNISEGFSQYLPLKQNQKLKIKDNPLQLGLIDRRNVTDYQDEFMSRKDEFSPSWRELLEKDMRKFR